MSTPADHSQSNLSKATGFMGNVVGGSPQAVPPHKPVGKTIPKAQAAPDAATHGAPAQTTPSSPQSPPRPKASAQVDAQSVLETARAAVQNLAHHNANQAQRLGVELARAEQAFPLVMMDAYTQEKQALREAGLDAQTFLRELGEQVQGVAAFDATITIAATAERPLLAGSDSQA